MDRLLSRLANGLMLVFAGYFVFSWLHSVGGLWVILAVLVGLCLLPFVVGPVILHQTQKISLQTNLVPFDPEGPGSPELLRSHFATTRADLLRLGFTPERYYQAKNAHSHAEGWVLLFRNRITGETARILTSVGVAADASVSIGTSFLVLASEFTDGTVIVTSNRTSAWILPPRKPPYHGQAFPRVPEVGGCGTSIAPGSRCLRPGVSPWTSFAMIPTPTSTASTLPNPSPIRSRAAITATTRWRACNA